MSYTEAVNNHSPIYLHSTCDFTDLYHIPLKHLFQTKASTKIYSFLQLNLFPIFDYPYLPPLNPLNFSFPHF